MSARGNTEVTKPVTRRSRSAGEPWSGDDRRWSEGDDHEAVAGLHTSLELRSRGPKA
jgi:hypothetical protein